MKRNEYMNILLEDFEKWYLNNHGKNEDCYIDILTKENINSWQKKEFTDFFYNFVADGGKIQSGGHRKKNDFLKTLETNYSKFKDFIIEPFENEFNINNWLFHERNQFDCFGIGIATIYLNRINKNKYSIVNNKTIKSLQALEYDIPNNKNKKSYDVVNSIQTELIKQYKTLKNFFKVDALNEFIIGKSKYIKKLEIFKDSIFIPDIEIAKNIKIETSSLSKDELKNIIIENQSTDCEYINNNGKICKRKPYLMNLIKRLRGYKCQFCDRTLWTKENDYYIEACHITPKGEHGADELKNIIVLCPYCHKLLDKAHREDIERTDSIYKVKLNGIIYEVNLD